MTTTPSPSAPVLATPLRLTINPASDVLVRITHGFMVFQGVRVSPGGLYVCNLEERLVDVIEDGNGLLELTIKDIAGDCSKTPIVVAANGATIDSLPELSIVNNWAEYKIYAFKGNFYIGT